MDLVEALEVEEYVDHFSAVVESLLDQSLQIFLRHYTTRDYLVVGYPAE